MVGCAIDRDGVDSVLAQASGQQGVIMATPYSQDLRDRVLIAYQRGMKTKQIAEIFCVSPAWARRVKQRKQNHGETKPRKVGSLGIRKISREQLAQLVAQFSKIKQLLRSLGCRTKEALWQAMQSVLDQVTPTDAANCLRHCGYTVRVD